MIFLKLGSKGDEVRRLQRALNLLADGNFGPKTEKALKDWQYINHLTADGIAGPKTLIKLGIISASLDLSKLKGIVPDKIIDGLPMIMEKYHINTVLRLAHFLAQLKHESGNFKVTIENLNYSAAGLKKTFPQYFPNDLHKVYANKPERIANRVYANRMGNGNEASGDGWKYRGRGYIQLTGKNNYKAFSNFINDDAVENPNLILEKYTLISSAWFWETNRINELSDLGRSDEIVAKVTKKVNGGSRGLKERIQNFSQYYTLLLIK